MMKKLNLFIGIFLVLHGTASFAQTKEETEQWLNEKFNKYNGSWLDIYMGQDLYWHTSTFDFQLKDGYLTVKESFRYKSYYSDQGERVLQSRDIMYRMIPVYNIIDIYESDFREKPCIGVRLERYRDYNVYEDYSHWNISDDIQGERYTNKKLKDTDSGYDSFNLFLPDKEEKLLERTIKALKHYQTFYPKPEKKKETF